MKPSTISTQQPLNGPPSPTSSRSSTSSSPNTPRHHSRSNSETLHQTEPFQEEWQDTPATQQELIQNFRRGVENVRENTGAIRESDREAEETDEDETEPYDDDYWIDEEEERAPILNRSSNRTLSVGPLKRQSSYDQTQNIKIRDFAYPLSLPLHYGLPLTPTTPSALASYDSSPLAQQTFAESDDIFNNRQARALFDFEAENPSEVSFRENETIWIQYRQCPGWLVADVRGQTGLVPESWVEMMGDNAAVQM